MYLHQLTLGILGLSSFTQGRPPHHEDLQHPILKPTDNFTLSPIREALVSNKIIPDVLNDFEPTYYIDIVYEKSNAQVSLGNEIKTKAVSKRPRFGIHDIPDSQKPPQTSDPVVFTLILTDPDATSRYNPKWSEMCHWIMTNLTAAALNSGTFEGGRELVPLNPDFDPESKPGQCKKDKQGGKCLPGELESYFSPAPPPKTGWHRYTFVLLAGDSTQLRAPKERKHWGYGEVRHGVRDWAVENGLTVVGANFFFAKNKKQ